MTSLSVLFLVRTHSVHSLSKGTLDTPAPGRGQTEKQSCGGTEDKEELVCYNRNKKDRHQYKHNKRNNVYVCCTQYGVDDTLMIPCLGVEVSVS